MNEKKKSNRITNFNDLFKMFVFIDIVKKKCQHKCIKVDLADLENAPLYSTCYTDDEKCDGKKHCQGGDDEESCNNFLGENF